MIGKNSYAEERKKERKKERKHDQKTKKSPLQTARRIKLEYDDG
ncbi:hypothetical protein [Sphingobacterium ginsenosidimutans]|uniref:Uncharacterized protein n=1 Tax=Sphingobacterium ginsenosidimutans TaxID=687845 RepID=A0ABP8ACC7_9SPHI